MKGRVKEVIGLIVRASVPEAWIGELCLIYNPRSSVPVKAEVVGFQDGDVLLMPLGDLVNIGPQSDVVGFQKLLWVVRLANLQRDPTLYLVYLALQLVLMWDYRVLEIVAK